MGNMFIGKKKAKGKEAKSAPKSHKAVPSRFQKKVPLPAMPIDVGMEPPMKKFKGME